jgi:hypothetical protein
VFWWGLILELIVGVFQGARSLFARFNDPRREYERRRKAERKRDEEL